MSRQGAMRTILMLLLAVVSGSAAAALWKCTDAGGAVRYLPEAVTDGSETCIALVIDKPQKAVPLGGKKKALSSPISTKVDGWVQVTSTESNTFFADLATKRRNGHMVKMWVLLDFKTLQPVNGESAMSKTEQDEFDCKEGSIRNLFASYHSKNMRAGEIVQTINRTMEWVPVPPGSVGEYLLNFACGKR